MARKDEGNDAGRQEGGRGRDAGAEPKHAAGESGETTGGRKGPVRVPGNEIEDGGNIARPGSGERKDHSIMPVSGTQEQRPGASRQAFGRKAGPDAKVNAASSPQREE